MGGKNASKGALWAVLMVLAPAWSYDRASDDLHVEAATDRECEMHSSIACNLADDHEPQPIAGTGGADDSGAAGCFEAAANRRLPQQEFVGVFEEAVPARGR